MRHGVLRGLFEITPPSYHPIVKMKLNLKSIPSQKENVIKALLICLKTLETKTMLVTGKFDWVCVSPHVVDNSIIILSVLYKICRLSDGIIFFLQNLQNVLAGFDSGRLVKVGDAKITFLFQVEGHLTETST